MKDLKKSALIVALVDKLLRRGSWCGETHLQKTTYFLQGLLSVPTGFDFILYKHGPFSFDLRDELTRLRAYGYLDLLPQPPYGPSLEVTKAGKNLLKDFPKTTKKYEKEIEFVARHFGTKGVAELEKYATAFYVTKENKLKGLEKRAEEVSRLKPHVSVPDAIAVTRAIDKIIVSSKSV